jgi:hypothetical protein
MTDFMTPGNPELTNISGRFVCILSKQNSKGLFKSLIFEDKNYASRHPSRCAPTGRKWQDNEPNDSDFFYDIIPRVFCERYGLCRPPRPVSILSSCSAHTRNQKSDTPAALQTKYGACDNRFYSQTRGEYIYNFGKMFLRVYFRVIKTMVIWIRNV